MDSHEGSYFTLSQQIEIEFKNMLTKDEYDKFIQIFKIERRDIFKQINYYIDSDNFSLKEKMCALRVREKNGNYKLTLKQPVLEGLLETDQPITKEQFQQICDKRIFPEGPVTKVINEIGLSCSDLKVLGKLQTNRISFPYKDGILFLDHSEYLGKVDYELEYEVNDRSKGEKEFLHLLNSYHIPNRETDNKINRFFLEKKNQTL
jgi:uncharacterized protein YjbK